MRGDTAGLTHVYVPVLWGSGDGFDCIGGPEPTKRP